MEIRLKGNALPCVAIGRIKAGLAVKLCGVAATSIHPDVTQGCRIPDVINDPQAKYVVGFRVYNEVPPIYESLPTLDIGTTMSGTTGYPASVPYVLRDFIASSSNLPASVTLRMTSPRLQEEQFIESGSLCLAYDNGIYMVTSGCYEGSSFVPGDIIGAAANGAWRVTDHTTSGRIGTVWEWQSGELTIKTGY
jgi:hypothetical protein